MSRNAFVAVAAAVCSLAAASVCAKPFVYTLPDDSVAMKPGPNFDVAQGNCRSCHSADYIATQPRDRKDKKAFWQTEVTKMIGVYGAPIDPADVSRIVDYLTATY